MMCARVRAMQYLMNPANPASVSGRMHTASGLKMALPQSGTERLVAGSSRNASCSGVEGGGWRVEVEGGGGGWWLVRVLIILIQR